VFFGCHRALVVVWDLSRTQPGAKHERVLLGHDRGINSMMVSADSKRLITGGMEGRAIVWDVKTGRELARIDTLHEDILKMVLSKEAYTDHRRRCIYATAFSADGRSFAIGLGDGSVKIFDLPKEFSTGSAR
jgi:WD40 repeat protein